MSQAEAFSRDHSVSVKIIELIWLVAFMLPPFCCSASQDLDQSHRRYQERKLAMLSFWRDGLERQLSAINASIATLQKQMERDQATD